MKQSQIALGFLLPADENPPEAIHPTVGPLHHPVTDFAASLSLDRLGLLTADGHMGRIAELPDQIVYRVAVVSLVQAQVLWLLTRGLGPANRHAFQSRPGQLAVVSVGAIDGQSDRDALGVGQKAAFDAAFGPVGRIGAAFFPLPRGPWSSLHPGIANASQSGGADRIPASPSSTTARTPRRRSMSGTTGAPRNWNRCLWRSRRSTDNPSARRRRWHSWPCEARPGDYDSPADAACRAAIAAQSFPIGRREFATDRRRQPLAFVASCSLFESFESLSISCGIPHASRDLYVKHSLSG
jgi:hypothetical protein